MKQKLVLSAILAAALLMSACGTTAANGATDAAQTAEAAGAQKISAEAAYERIQSGDELVILDVRTAEEYETAHIPGAILIPNEEIGDERPALLPVIDTEILIYCRSGNRSAQAAAKLEKLGYTALYDFGGINDWPYETESGAWQQEEKDGSFASFRSFDLAGVARDESIFADNTLTMVNVWATYCGPCLSELPELGELAAEYADKKVGVVGVVADVRQSADGSFSQKAVENTRYLVEQTGAAYIHLLPDASLVSNQLSGVSAVPTTFFVDSRGNLVGEAYIGSRSGADWAKIIDRLLEEAGA